MTALPPRICAWPACGVVFTPTSAATRYHGDACRRLGKNAWARRDKARIDGHAKGTRSTAAVARAGTVRRVVKPLVWINAVPPAVMAEAKRELAARLAREEARTTRGRPKGRAS